MDESESIYLDLVRFTAAVCVVVNHLLHNDVLHPAIARAIPDFGREAVMVFFVLSGYVICYTTETRNASLKSYLTARAARLYSVAGPVLLLAFLIDSVAIQFNADNYHHLYQYEKFYLYIPLHLGFLGEVWFLAERPFTIPAYWSLSYEAWYYVLFASLYFYSGRKRIVFALLIALLVGYQHWILFPVWMSGVALYRYRDRLRLSVTVARIGLVSTIAAAFILEFTGLDIALWQLGRSIWPFPNLPQGSADQFLLDYVICTLVVINFWCARYAQLSWILSLSNPIRALASYTFTLYLVHTLVIYTWLRNFTYDQYDSLHCVAMVGLIGVVTWGVGELTEKRKMFFVRMASWLADAIERTLISSSWITRALAPNRAL